jgi:hypothetical protein
MHVQNGHVLVNEPQEKQSYSEGLQRPSRCAAARAPSLMSVAVGEHENISAI